jgi:hypothetical protein
LARAILNVRTYFTGLFASDFAQSLTSPREKIWLEEKRKALDTAALIL